jgi:hypothetical protein
MHVTENPPLDAAHAILVGVLILATAVWLGGYVAIAVVARVATRTLVVEV